MTISSRGFFMISDIISSIGCYFTTYVAQEVANGQRIPLSTGISPKMKKRA